MSDVHTFSAGDFIICKPAEELREPSNKDFEVYARVIKVDRSCNAMEIVSFLKQGQLLQGRRGLPLDQCEEHYYQPMDKQDLESFIRGLFGLLTSVNYLRLMESQRALVRSVFGAAVKAWMRLAEEEEMR